MIADVNVTFSDLNLYPSREFSLFQVTESGFQYRGIKKSIIERLFSWIESYKKVFPKYEIKEISSGVLMLAAIMRLNQVSELAHSLILQLPFVNYTVSHPAKFRGRKYLALSFHKVDMNHSHQHIACHF